MKQINAAKKSDGLKNVIRRTFAENYPAAVRNDILYLTFAKTTKYALFDPLLFVKVWFCEELLMSV